MSNKSKVIFAVFIGLVLIVGITVLFHKQSSDVDQVSQNKSVAIPLASASATDTLSPMQNTGMLFSQYKYYSKANEIFPTMATTTKEALGAFSYTKTDLGNNIYKFTLVNNAEGYKGQSVTVSADQSVYFIEPFKRDDSVTEDSVTTDDILMAVNAQGYILK